MQFSPLTKCVIFVPPRCPLLPTEIHSLIFLSILHTLFFPYSFFLSHVLGPHVFFFSFQSSPPPQPSDKKAQRFVFDSSFLPPLNRACIYLSPHDFSLLPAPSTNLGAHPTEEPPQQRQYTSKTSAWLFWSNHPFVTPRPPFFSAPHPLSNLQALFPSPHP